MRPHLTGTRGKDRGLPEHFKVATVPDQHHMEELWFREDLFRGSKVAANMHV